MANEISITAILSFAKGASSDDLAVENFLVNMAGTKFHHGTQIVGTSEEPLNLADVGTGCMCMLWNRDATNYVQVFAESGGTPLIRIKAGMPAIFSLDPLSTAPQVKANTAAVELEVLLVEA